MSTSIRKLALRFATSSTIAASFAALFSFGCVAETPEDVASSADELRSHASEAGIHEWSAEARAVLAVANDRSLGIDDYVYRVKISRKTAQAIIDVRNGTNGENESRPIYWGWGWGSSTSGGPVPVDGDPSLPPYYPYPPYPCGWGGSSGSSGWGGDAIDAGVGSSGGWGGYPVPPPPMCIVDWELGGDDEEFTRLSELDALPGTDVSAFKNLLTFARQNGYYQPPPVVDAGPPVFPDGGVVVDAGPPRLPDGGIAVDAGPPSFPDGGSFDAGRPW